MVARKKFILNQGGKQMNDPRIKLCQSSVSRATGKGKLALAAGLMAMTLNAQDASAQEKFKIYLSLSYSGNDWQTEAANIVKALAATPPYDQTVELTEVISGTDPQAQISAYQSMIAAGADGIISFPVSPTALNRTIKRGCDQGVLFFNYDATVTEPCAYNVSYITSGYGENTAQWLVNQLGGEGKIFMNRGVPGNSVDKRHTDGALSVFNKYPGIQVVSEYYGMWSAQTSQEETAKALVAHPEVDGIWTQYGEEGVLKAVLASGRDKLMPITGENSNAYRLALLDPDLKAKGFTGLSSGSSPSQSGYAFKIMMEMLTGQREQLPEGQRNLEYPLPWVPAEAVKICEGNEFAEGCNTFPKGKVPESFTTEVYEPVLLPELSLISALEGLPTPGVAIQPLPAELKQATNEPGINCQGCQPPEDLYKLTKIEATVQP
ncbi:sugar ABC transporter substrate-binding protein [Pseudosulfitobacter sp. RP-4]